MFLDLLLFIVVAIVLVFFITQIAIPLKNGTPIFPYFRESTTAVAVENASNQLEEIAELERLHDLQAEIKRRKAQLEKDEE